MSQWWHFLWTIQDQPRSTCFETNLCIMLMANGTGETSSLYMHGTARLHSFNRTWRQSLLAPQICSLVGSFSFTSQVYVQSVLPQQLLISNWFDDILWLGDLGRGGRYPWDSTQELGSARTFGAVASACSTWRMRSGRRQTALLERRSYVGGKTKRVQSHRQIGNIHEIPGRFRVHLKNCKFVGSFWKHQSSLPYGGFLK